MSGALTFNGDQAKRYLRHLDPEADRFTFQTFDDNKERKAPALVLIRDSQDPPAALARIQRQGGGVFVTVNATDGNGRKSENITRVRAVWQEDDDGYEGEFPLEPSLVVQSSEGKFHRYWLVADDWPADEKGRADFAAVMARMVASYGCDKSAKDLARVMRLPGYWHLKGEPQLVQLVDDNAQRYTRAEILAAFPPIAEPKPRANGQATHMHLRRDETERARDALSRVPSDDYDTWIRVGMALMNGLGDAGFAVWREWSAKADNFNDDACRTHWRSFKPDGATRFATVFGIAQDHGWQATLGENPPSAGREPSRHGKQEAEAGENSPVAVPLRSFSMWDKLRDKEPPPLRVTHIERWMPGDDVTALFGDGGKGKTQLGLQLAYCTTTRMQFLGMEVRDGPAIALSAEEHDDELHLRGWQVAQGIIVPDEAIRHPFEVVSRAAEDARLCTFYNGVIQPTALWLELVEMIGDLKAALCTLDAAADLYGGNENDRSQVQQFIAMLRKPALEFKCAMLLAGHPSVDGMKTGRGYSGSTAWNNSPRARWGFNTPKAKDAAEDDDEPDQALRELTLEKTNRGAPGVKIRLRWVDGCFVTESGARSLLDLAEAKTRFLELLDAWTKQGRNVSHKPKANNYAPTEFARNKSGKRFPRDTYRDAMNALFDEERIHVVQVGKKSDGVERIERT